MATDIRAVIAERLVVLDWSTYRLVKELTGKVPPASVYDFMRGTSSLRIDSLNKVFDVLGLEIVTRKGK